MVIAAERSLPGAGGRPGMEPGLKGHACFRRSDPAELRRNLWVERVFNRLGGRPV
jgi:hypothetical protein